MAATEIIEAESLSRVLEIARESVFEMVVAHVATPPWLSDSNWAEIRRVCRGRPVIFLVEKADSCAIRLSRIAGRCTILDIGTESVPALYGRFRRALKGAVYVSRSIRCAVARDRVNPELLLTPGQRRVLEVIGTGMDDVQASALLGIQPVTVMTHRSRLMRKLGVRHRGELIRAAIRYGYVTIGADGDLSPAFGEGCSRPSSV